MAPHHTRVPRLHQEQQNPERTIKINIVPLPDQSEGGLAVAILDDFYQLFFGVSVVFGGQRVVLLYGCLYLQSQTPDLGICRTRRHRIPCPTL
jgi:hypothetical protein